MGGFFMPQTYNPPNLMQNDHIWKIIALRTITIVGKSGRKGEFIYNVGVFKLYQKNIPQY